MDEAQKICPQCRRLAAVSEKFCRSCGHKFRTVFTSQPADSPAPPAPLFPLVVVPLPPPESPRERPPARQLPSLPVGSALKMVAAWKLPAPRVPLRKLAAGLGIAALLGGVVWGAMQWNPDGESAQSVFASMQMNFARLEAADLDKEYRRNPTLADQKYKGKLVEIKAVVREAGTGVDFLPYAKVEGWRDGSLVLCKFEPGAQVPVSSLSPGQHIAVSGICRGRVAGLVTLGDCVLQESAFSFNSSSIPLN